ncbi:MAG: isoprenylcysteine carboxylmethyltransferase family protein [Chloroflexi bacterium]|nr:isoprenylcysteine carboxylmethyltransferase family protein [Chloroflexota bacterium]
MPPGIACFTISSPLSPSCPCFTSYGRKRRTLFSGKYRRRSATWCCCCKMVGLVGLALSLWQTDIWEFVGLRQAWRYLRGETELTLPPKLVTQGPYALVRHPLYFFSMLLLWFNPVMTLNSFFFNTLASAYFWAGSRVEERRLADFFGEQYQAYRRRVPGLFPLPRPRDDRN